MVMRADSARARVFVFALGVQRPLFAPLCGGVAPAVGESSMPGEEAARSGGLARQVGQFARKDRASRPIVIRERPVLDAKKREIVGSIDGTTRVEHVIRLIRRMPSGLAASPET